MKRREGITKACFAGDHWVEGKGGCNGFCKNATAPKTSYCKCPCHEAQREFQRKYQEQCEKERKQNAGNTV